MLYIVIIHIYLNIILIFIYKIILHNFATAPWEPKIAIRDGLKQMYFWIKEQIDEEEKKGTDVTKFSASEVVVQTDESSELLS
jgi:hypothetical protein